MAKFLTTTGISYELEELIKLAKERVVLVSPYLKLGDKLRMHLEDKDRMKVEMRIIYGKADLQPEESAKLEALKELKLGFLKNLHAKCYMSEDRAILASMNLYEFSQVNNEEMGILVTAADDPALFQAIKDDVSRLIRMSDTVSITVARVPSSASGVVPAREAKGPPERASAAASSIKKGGAHVVPEDGFCIRCAEPIPFDREKPYCEKDYKSWSRWSNPDYEDSYCHHCGEEHPATKNKPLCRDCFKLVA